MYEQIQQACQMQALVSVHQIGHADDFFVGLIEGYNRHNILLYSLDPSGRAEAHILFPLCDLAEIVCQSPYLDKLRLLSSRYPQTPYLLGQKENLLEFLLQALHQTGVQFEVTFLNGMDRLLARVLEIRDEDLDLAIETDAGNANGIIRTLKSQLHDLFLPVSSPDLSARIQRQEESDV